jgi:Glycosyltransferase sugar-binding region containing DXD motif/Alpha 1,4-glycosyltransferase conserved region
MKRLLSTCRTTLSLTGMVMALLPFYQNLHWTGTALMEISTVGKAPGIHGEGRIRTSKQKTPQALPVFHIVISNVRKTSSLDGYLSTLNLRCIESIFYFHAKATLLIHANRETGLQRGLEHPTLQALMQRGYDLRVLYYEPQEMLQRVLNAPNSEIDSRAVRNFVHRIDSARKQERNWHIGNEANLIRLCILYLEGGIYVDADVVFLNDRFATDPRIDQAMGRHRDGSKFQNAVMKFSRPGNRLLAAVLNKMIDTYSGTKWGNNGSKTFGRMAKAWPDWVCPEDTNDYINNTSLSFFPAHKGDLSNEHDQECYLTPLPNDSVAPISYKEWDKLCFDENGPSYIEAKHRLDNSFVVHFNHKNTGSQIRSKAYQKGSLCDHVLSSYCIVCEELTHTS